MYQVLYNPGAAGDMLAAVIDSKDYDLTNIDVRARPDTLRLHFKLAIIKNNGSENILYSGSRKTPYLEEIEKKYTAITCSHDFDFGLQSIIDTILIDDSDYKYAKWCMERSHIILPKFHPPFTETELARRIQRVKFAKKYGRIRKVISMQDILKGRLIEKLQQWIDTPLNTEIYNHWLHKIIAPLPKVD
jgi:hypothetical protein